MQNRYVIIVAGGSGSRMNSDLPKQFLPLNGIPVLMHTIRRFAQAKSQPNIVLVLHADMLLFWEELCQEHHFSIAHRIVTGGATRFQSVRNGLDAILQAHSSSKLSDVLVAIHDAARPLISPRHIDRCFEETTKYGATVLAVTSTNSIRQGNEIENSALDRNHIWMVQTPQTFRGDILQQAFLQQELPSFTDDASVVERSGHRIQLIPGDSRNIKITFPEDMAIAELFLPAIPD